MKNSKLKQTNFKIVISNHRLNARRFSHMPEVQSRRPVLVFLHEALGCVDMWHDFPEKLAKATGCDALVYDRLGHGGSDILPLSNFHGDYLFDEAWQMLPRVLSACRANPAILFGHSDGGTIALLFAAKHPEKVKGIITEAAHVFVDDMTTDGIKHTIAKEDSSNIKEKLAKYHGENTERIYERWHSIWLSKEFASWNIESYLGKIKVPLLGMQGKEDFYGTEDQLKSIVSNSGGYAKEIFIPDCGHIPHKENPEVVLNETSKFISSYCL